MGGNLMNKIFLMLKGMAMGIAEVIPGVSGGTIALISGIYEDLIDSIKSFDGKLIKMIFSGKIGSAFTHIQGTFLVFLMIGMGLGVVLGVFGVGFLLEEYPSPLWGFFCGIIIASSIFIGRKINPWTWVEIALLVVGVVIAFGITEMTPTEGNTNLIWVFVCGCIAISALILPGVSGSFILLLLGMYTVIRGHAEEFFRTFSTDSLVVIAVFGLGCIVGLLTFARVMSYFFKNYKNKTLSILTGFMVGSLWAIWPWQDPSVYIDKHTGVMIPAEMAEFPNESLKIVEKINVFPGQFNGEPQTIIVIFSFLIGISLIFVLDYFGSKYSTPKNNT